MQCCVLFPWIYPYKLLEILSFNRNSSLFKIILSSTLHIHDVSDIGRNSLGFPGFGIGIIIALFHALGNFPSFQIRLYNLRTGFATIVVKNLTTAYVMPSSPGAVDFPLFNATLSSSSVIEYVSAMPVDRNALPFS